MSARVLSVRRPRYGRATFDESDLDFVALAAVAVREQLLRRPP